MMMKMTMTRLWWKSVDVCWWKKGYTEAAPRRGLYSYAVGVGGPTWHSAESRRRHARGFAGGSSAERPRRRGDGDGVPARYRSMASPGQRRPGTASCAQPRGGDQLDRAADGRPAGGRSPTPPTGRPPRWWSVRRAAPAMSPTSRLQRRRRRRRRLWEIYSSRLLIGEGVTQSTPASPSPRQADGRTVLDCSAQTSSAYMTN